MISQLSFCNDMLKTMTMMHDDNDDTYDNEDGDDKGEAGGCEGYGSVRRR